jgi:phospholipid-binding lipoprotein MlaA
MKPRSPLALSFRTTGLRWALAVGALVLMTGCATGPNANPADPFEPVNRQVARFNDAVDDAVLRPVATVYQKTLPSPVRTGVNNFFSNLTDFWSFANSVAQLKLQDSAQTFMRLNVNTVFGLGGILDVATNSASIVTTRTSARRWDAGACRVARTWSFRCSVLRPCGMPPRSLWMSTAIR